VFASSTSFVRLLPLLALLACGKAEPLNSSDSGQSADNPAAENPAAKNQPSKGSSGSANGADTASAGASVETQQSVAVGPQPGQGEFVAYSQKVAASDVSIEMVPVAGGKFVMGSPADEVGRQDHEGPQIEVSVEPFWMGKYEIRWDEYDVWNTDEDRPQSKKPDGLARPTPAYMEMTFNMGRQGYPAICMSHVAARQYCKWLSEKTGEFYRLPTEAEWEYACRAGSKSAYSVSAEKLGEVAWFVDNSERELQGDAPPENAYHMVGKKAPNAFGLFDLHGNVAEWVADYYYEDAYSEAHGAAPRSNPYMQPLRDKRGRPNRWSHVARGGSWRSPAADLRSAARLASEPDWNQRDPQVPKSWWYLTDAQHIGFRIVRPLRAPSAEERARFENP
jgi:formylglycine-generating enzyme required for sulfatase activity